jgi:hypothetical protein
MSEIIAQEELGQWRAWFPDQPQPASDGNSLKTAVSGLLRAHGLEPADVHLLYHGASAKRHVFRFSRIPCPDCRGTGKYVGFSTVENCRGCSGRGYR